jgi:hypothetical protein
VITVVGERFSKAGWNFDSRDKSMTVRMVSSEFAPVIERSFVDAAHQWSQLYKLLFFGKKKER